LQPFKEACVLFDVVIVNTNEDNVKKMFFKDKTIDSKQEDIWFAEITQDNEQMVYEGIRLIHHRAVPKRHLSWLESISEEKIFQILKYLKTYSICASIFTFTKASFKTTKYHYKEENQLLGNNHCQ
jgi:hypothetical protein